MRVILYHRAGGLSAPVLAQFMGIKAVRKLTKPVECLIRWGLATKIEPQPDKEINPRSALARYFSRLKQLTLLEEAGVSVPPFSTNAPVIGYPMLGRDEGHKRQYTRGGGIHFYPEMLPKGMKHSFYTRFFPKQRQFRVHVIGGRSRTRELIPDSQEAMENAIWNYHTGFTYRNLKADRPEGVIPQAKAAIKALQLDFGAVDVIVHDNTPYVLEVNTAPGLGPLTLSWYARHLASLIGMDPTSLPGLKQEVPSPCGS